MYILPALHNGKSKGVVKGTAFDSNMPQVDRHSADIGLIPDMSYVEVDEDEGLELLFGTKVKETTCIMIARALG